MSNNVDTNIKVGQALNLAIESLSAQGADLKDDNLIQEEAIRMYNHIVTLRNKVNVCLSNDDIEKDTVKRTKL